MNTRFQISMQRESFRFTSAPRVSPFGVRSTCSSEQGPHGPVSPIIQKLSFFPPCTIWTRPVRDRKSTRLNSSHRCISYAVFCLKKKKKKNQRLLDIHTTQITQTV